MLINTQIPKLLQIKLVLFKKPDFAPFPPDPERSLAGI
jgi:hypothetical protein